MYSAFGVDRKILALFSGRHFALDSSYTKGHIFSNILNEQGRESGENNDWPMVAKMWRLVRVGRWFVSA